jgi:hypothetical protein
VEDKTTPASSAQLVEEPDILARARARLSCGAQQGHGPHRGRDSRGRESRGLHLGAGVIADLPSSRQRYSVHMLDNLPRGPRDFANWP